ncbi:unnamed protein product [Brassica oleracea]|uniref:(rape) hypothetical protein n=1 Tax=Brassica napus TaxID=3708 RepID=A0A816IH44_BRANA|nr:unnamed protein product [Brassica napus]
MEKKKQRSEVSSTEAVLLGALAPGVNVRILFFFLPSLSMLFIKPYLDRIFLQASTWNTLKLSFLMLGLCLTFMLSIAFTSGQSMLLVHVGFLIVIASSLFVLLNWYIIQGRLTRGTSGATDPGPSPVPLPV